MKKILTLLSSIFMVVCLGIILTACGGNEPPEECSHVFGEWTSELNETCSQDGQYRRFCTLCPYSETKTVPATGIHNPIYTVFPERTEPTCTTSGRIEATFCSHCGIQLSEVTELPSVGHNYVDYKCTSCNTWDTGVSPIGVRAESWDDQYNIVAFLTKNADGITYTLNIRGRGETQDFGEMSGYNFPWKAYKDLITAVVVENKSDDEVITKLGRYIFNGLSALSSVTLPDTVTEIGNHAFYDCTSLEGITLPGGLKSIAHSAFKNCTSLKSVIAPAAVEQLGEDAFNQCYALEEVDLSLSQITEIPDWAFCGCTKLKEIKLPKAEPSADFSGVVAIGYYAFSDCVALESITIENVQRIEECAFYGCTFLHTVELYDIDYVGREAFKNCVSLESFDFKAATSVGCHAFIGCENLKKISFSSSGEVALYNYYSYTSDDAPFYEVDIEEIHIDYIEKWLRSNLHLALRENTKIYLDGTLLEELSIPYGITEIKGRFNGYSYLKAITIPEWVTKIPDYAFAGTSISELVIPDTVEYIGWDYVSGCANLEKLTVPFLGRTADFEEWDNYAKNQFGEGLSSLCELVITGPKTGNYRVPHRAFDSVSYPIKTLRIGENVTALGNSCFAGLPLQNVYFDNISITSIADGAFNYCDEIENVYVTTATGDGIDAWLSIDFGLTVGTNPLHGGNAKLYFNDELLTILDLTGKDFAEIAEFSFHGYSYLEEIKLSNSITKIGDFAFYNCTGLKKLTIRQGLASVESQAFCGCTSLEKILFGAFKSDDLSIDPIFEENYKNFAIAQWKKISFAYDSNPLMYADKFFIVTYEGAGAAEDEVCEIDTSELQ